MTPIHFGIKRRFWLLRALGAIAMAAVSAMFLRANLGSFVAWLGVLGLAFFAVGAGVGFFQLTRSGPRLTLDEHGVHDCSLGVGVIAWSDIASVAPYSVAGEPFVALNLRDPAKYIARASGLKGMLARRHVASGMPAFSVNLVGLDADPARVTELIGSRITPDRSVADDRDDRDDRDDDSESEPPPARRVAERALVLAGVTCRAAIEDDAGNPAAEAFRHEVVAWLTRVGAIAEAERAERRLLEAPLGTLDERHIMNAGWRGEGLGVLAWALGRRELPAYQEIVRSADVADAVGFMRPEGETLLQSPTLRRLEELETLAARMFALHWRLREFLLRRRAMDFASFARTAPFGPLDVTGLEFADGDLAIDGRPLARVDERRWRECLSIAQERQQAANWLCGQGRLYSNVGTDT